MNRFSLSKRNSTKRKGLLALGVTLLLLLSFSAVLSSASQITREEEKKHLEQALHQNIIQCYIIEGAYPQSLSYLEAHYPLLYNRDAFYIDYQPIGENIFPDVTILTRIS